MARTHANALATEVMQHRMAQRHHLSKALAVSLFNSNEGFCREKGRPFDLEVFCIFDTSLIKDSIYKIVLDYFLVLKPFPGDPVLHHHDFRGPLFKKMRPRFPY